MIVETLETIAHVDFSGTLQRNKSFSNHTYMYCNFKDTKFKFCRFENAIFIGCIFKFADIVGLKVINTTFKDCDFEGAEIRNPYFEDNTSNGCVESTVFNNCDMSNVKYTNITFSSCKFYACNLNGSYFESGTDFITSTFSYCDLTTFTGKPFLPQNCLAEEAMNNFEERINFLNIVNLTGEDLYLMRNGRLHVIHATEPEATVKVVTGIMEWSGIAYAKSIVKNLPFPKHDTIYIVDKKVYDCVKRTDVGYYYADKKVIVI